jgi:hypothetical protein
MPRLGTMCTQLEIVNTTGYYKNKLIFKVKLV